STAHEASNRPAGPMDRTIGPPRARAVAARRVRARRHDRSSARGGEAVREIGLPHTWRYPLQISAPCRSRCLAAIRHRSNEWRRCGPLLDRVPRRTAGRAARPSRRVHRNVDDSRMTRFYSVHSRVVAVSAWPELMAAIHARLEPFAIESSTLHDVELTFEAVDAQAAEHMAMPGGRRVYEFPDGEVTYHDAEDRLTITVGDRVCAICEPGTGQARVFVESPQPSDL